MSRIRKLIVLLLFLQLLVPARTVAADTGPKPSMDFEFTQDSASESMTIASGILYECQQSDCRDAKPLEEVGPQGFYCQEDSCSATAYGFAPYHRIEITFSDGKTRSSNVFETAGFESRYNVTVRPEDLLVETQFNPWVFPPNVGLLVLCVCLACGGALLLGLIIFLIVRRTRK